MQVLEAIERTRAHTRTRPHLVGAPWVAFALEAQGRSSLQVHAGAELSETGANQHVTVKVGLFSQQRSCRGDVRLYLVWTAQQQQQKTERLE